MSYAIELYETTGFENVQTKLFSPRISVRRWSRRINDAGVCYFTIPKNDEKATEEILRHKRRMILYRKNEDTAVYDPVWNGFIQDWRDIDANREVVGHGMLAALESRRTANDEEFNGQGGTEVSDLLSAVNSAGETGISAGTIDITTTRDVKMSGRATAFDAIETLGKAHQAEYEVDLDAKLNFVEALGTDKSAIVHMIYREDGSLSQNVREIQVAYEGGIVNKLYGKSGELESIKSDSESIAKYGLQEDEVNFSEAQDQATLDAMSAALLSQKKQPIPDAKVVPDSAHLVVHPVTGDRQLTGLQYGDVDIGDLIMATIITPNQTINNVVKRIAEISVQVGDDGMETIAYTLTDAGIYVTSSYLQLAEQRDIRRRLAALESSI